MSFYELQLTKGYVAKISYEDIDLISHKWYAQIIKRGGKEWVYACRSGGIYLHRVIAERMSPGMPVVDHRDGDTLNDQRYNLRPTSYSINGINQQATKGYCYSAQAQRWKAYIWIEKQFKHLGYFDTEEEARAARKVAEMELGI